MQVLRVEQFLLESYAQAISPCCQFGSIFNYGTLSPLEASHFCEWRGLCPRHSQKWEEWADFAGAKHPQNQRFN
jgi:hypothetical protein